MDNLLHRRDFVLGSGALMLASQSTAGAFVNSSIDGPGFVVSGTSKWLLPNFGGTLRNKIKDSPFSLRDVCAIAYQETGYRWWNSKFRGQRTPKEVLRLLVLDTHAERNPFPKNTNAFKADPRFADLSSGLIAAADAASQAEGSGKPGLIRYGYGLFQNDLQNIEHDAAFWRSQAPGEPAGVLGLWGDIEASTNYFMKELMNKYAAKKDVDQAIRAYNGSNQSSIIYLANVKIYREALKTAGI